MFKRQYFISVDTILDDGSTARSWRQFCYKSWFPRPALAITTRLDEIALQNDTTTSKMVVVSFNRC